MENKLKTLKDIEHYVDTSEEYEGLDEDSIITGIFDDLKQEAIKHIRELEISKNRGERLQSLLIKYRAEGKIDWIKHFFNITDDELCFQKTKPIRVTLTKKQIKQLEKEKFNDTAI